MGTLNLFSQVRTAAGTTGRHAGCSLVRWVSGATVATVEGHGDASADRCVGRAEDGAIVAIDGPVGLLEALGPWWPPLGLVRVDRPDGAHADVSPSRTVELSGEVSWPTVAVDGIHQPGGWDRVESDVGLFAAEHLAHRVAVHAGLVEWHGAALVVPGTSHAGKSTLILALAEAGAQVLSDEYALVDPDTGLVQGWPRPVRRRMPDGTITRPLVPAPLAPPIPVAVVAAVHYVAGATLTLHEAEASEAALDLLANTVPGQARPGPSLAAAAAVARSATATRGVRGEAPEAAEALLALVDRARQNAADVP